MLTRLLGDSGNLSYSTSRLAAAVDKSNVATVKRLLKTRAGRYSIVVGMV